MAKSNVGKADSSNQSAAYIEMQLETAKQKLLDITMRNRLLNHRPSKGKTIRIVEEIPKEIYDILVINGKEMRFKAQDNAKTLFEYQNTDNMNLESDTIQDGEMSEIWVAPVDETVEKQHIDRNLQTNLDKETLQKRLLNISQQAKTVFEEQGYTVLYLAMGFLEWYESDASTQPRFAPLILIPIELKRERVGAPFKVRWTEEDIFTNISLQTKLLEQNIEMPDFEMPDEKNGIDDYYNLINKVIKSNKRFRILNDIYIGFFSFTKFVMYKDLDLSSWPQNLSPADYPLIKSVFGQEDRQTLSGFAEETVDETLSIRDLYHVVDADSSQIAVIEDVKMGRNLVVEGPPGTGKSQTIVNIIAELLASGKTVLFVSEKPAALDVVKRRLDYVGLGDFCLSLHSHKSNKKEVIDELKRTVMNECRPVKIPFENITQEIELMNNLNEYAKILRMPIGKLGKSVFELYGMKEKTNQHFSKRSKTLISSKFQDIENITVDERMRINHSMHELTEISPFPISTHPWRGCDIKFIMPSDRTEIETLLDNVKISITNLQGKVTNVVDLCGLNSAKTFAELNRTIHAAKIVLNAPLIEKNILTNRIWNDKERAYEILMILRSMDEERAKVIVKFKPETLNNHNIAKLKIEFIERSSKRFKIFDGRYRKMKKELLSFYRMPANVHDQILLNDLVQLTNCISKIDEIKEFDSYGKELFGKYWKSIKSDYNELTTIANWMFKFNILRENNFVSEKTMDIISNGVPEIFNQHINELEEANIDFNKLNASLMTRLNFTSENVFGKPLTEVSFDQYLSKIVNWHESVDKLQRWAQFNNICAPINESFAKSIVPLIRNDKIEPLDYVSSIEGNLADGLLNIAFQRYSSLAKFAGEVHEKRIELFANLDRDLLHINQLRLIQQLFNARPQIVGGAYPNSETGILLGEFEKKRKHLPTRRLMYSIGGLIQKIKPCFMMSPLSIAKFLDPQNTRFDVIIFDEASQVRPEDALGALLRGSKLVVLGDTRQLPPTTFFDSIVETSEDDETDDSTNIGDIESILHQCKKSFPQKMLRWHYRSKHESLIAVSNHEFYKNQLYVFPSAIHESKDLGLSFVHLPHSKYDRGGKQTNIIEAKEVAKAVIDHFTNYPDKSLMVGTFNKNQKDAIEMELEILRHQNPNIEHFFTDNGVEPFRVKNLETIQGDERDTVFISVGFGLNESGILPKKFGPLNQEGGERRLNVLISRAREKCVVFSNFKAENLPITPGDPVGVKALKVFLEYADTRHLMEQESSKIDSDSPFEEAVFQILTDFGYQVNKQVGCAGFRIDLAVVDPDKPGTYLIGIECDGAQYHSSRVARDRDRLRQDILQTRGWLIYRVWSTDWFMNRSETIKKLLDAVNKAKEEKKNNSYESPDKKTPPNNSSIYQNQSQSISVIAPKEDGIKTNQIIVQNYVKCSNLGIYIDCDLHKVPDRDIARAISSVVEVEGPVHTNEVVKRIRTLCGLGRAGHRIQEHIIDAIPTAVRYHDIKHKGEFLWPSMNKTLNVRRRNHDPPPDISFICDEEITEALKLVLANQFATEKNDLIKQASRLFGMQAVHEQTITRVNNVVVKLLRSGDLMQLPNEMIDLPK